jgi:hypothetical protein
LRRPGIDPGIAVIAFVAVGTALIWAIGQQAGPGRPGVRTVLLGAAAPLALAVAVAWLLTDRPEG